MRNDSTLQCIATEEDEDSFRELLPKESPRESLAKNLETSVMDIE